MPQQDRAPSTGSRPASDRRRRTKAAASVGGVAARLLVAAIYFGSGRLQNFDSILIGYTVPWVPRSGPGHVPAQGQQGHGRAELAEKLRGGITVAGSQWRLPSQEAPCPYKDLSQVVPVCEGVGLSRMVAPLRPVGVVNGPALQGQGVPRGRGRWSLMRWRGPAYRRRWFREIDRNGSKGPPTIREAERPNGQ